MQIFAAPGALVRDPVTMRAIPELGSDAEPHAVDQTDLHWARLLRDGDVVLAPTKRK